MSKSIRLVVAVVLSAVIATCAPSSGADRENIWSATMRDPRVDLNAPGALEAVARSNPDHYDKIRRILEGILRRPEASVPRWIEVNFDGRDVSYLPIVLTSHPPKRRLSFALDTTRYEAIIVLTNVRGEIVPLR